MNNLEIAKWTEIWLDSCGERAYQTAFVSALAYRGYRVVHNTRHNSLELGKDVICTSPEGDLIAFQLKGNPGSRLTMSQWQSIYAQILQLVITPLPNLIAGKTKHRPILVTNGEVDEDVRSAIENLNQSFVPQYPSALPLELWTRGTLISLFAGVASSVWPTQLETQASLLRAITADPRDSLPGEIITEIATDTLEWHSIPSKPRLREKIVGLAMLAAIITTPQLRFGNLYEVIRIKAMIVGSIVGYMSKYAAFDLAAMRLYRLIRTDLFASISAFCEGLANRKTPWVNEGIIYEFGIYQERKILVSAIMAIHLIEKKGEVDEQLRRLALASVNYPFLSGEGMIPAFLAVFWAKQQYTGTMESDRELINVLATSIFLSKNKVLVSPYYTVEEVALWKYRAWLGRAWHLIDRDQRDRHSSFCYVLLCLLAKRNWKRTCQRYWPDVSRLVRQETVLEDQNEFAFFRSESTREEARLVPLPKSWDQLVADLRAPAQPPSPRLLAGDPVLCLLLLVFLPYRATEEIILWLDRQLCRTSY